MYLTLVRGTYSDSSSDQCIYYLKKKVIKIIRGTTIDIISCKIKKQNVSKSMRS